MHFYDKPARQSHLLTGEYDIGTYPKQGGSAFHI